MPTERFLNLPEAKQQRILAAAVQEFSRVPYPQVSINRIVHAAGIARGSFYQYFEGKSDLLDHLMRGFQQSMQQKVKESLKRSGGDLFAAFRDMLAAIVDFGSQPRNRAFCRNVFAAAQPCAEAGFQFMQADPAELLRRFIPHIDLSGFADTGEASLLLTLDTVLTLMRGIIARIFCDLDHAGALQQAFAQQLELIKHGVLAEKEGRVHV